MEARERGIRVPLTLIGGVFGYLQAGQMGAILGMAGGFIVGTLTTSMVAGVGILATGFALLWLQGGGAAVIGAALDPELAVPTESGDPAARPSGPAVGSGTLATTVAPGASGFVACVGNRVGRRMDFEYRWGRTGPWTDASLPPGGEGLVQAGEGDPSIFEARWATRAGATSHRTRWTRTPRVTGPFGLDGCPEVRALEFHREGSRIDLVRSDRTPRSMVCLINRTGVDLPYAMAWNDEAWATGTLDRGRRLWFDNDVGSTFRVRLPDGLEQPVEDGAGRTLETRDVRRGGDCMDGAAYIVGLDGDRVTLTPTG